MNEELKYLVRAAALWVLGVLAALPGSSAFNVNLSSDLMNVKLVMFEGHPIGETVPVIRFGGTGGGGVAGSGDRPLGSHRGMGLGRPQQLHTSSSFGGMAS